MHLAGQLMDVDEMNCVIEASECPADICIVVHSFSSGKIESSSVLPFPSSATGIVPNIMIIIVSGGLSYFEVQRHL
jgi:hypothetical protein